MVTALCGSFCIACPRPLTRRYVCACLHVCVTFHLFNIFLKAPHA
ncbi:hypothetical protein K6U61_11880 [Vibrio vulnificus]|nr:hypothetical protein [Vibrio vulnificus]